MNKLPNHLALKEWSSVVAALGSGEQVILIRKGGIADPKFGLEAERFYLYPTYFHQGEAEARASVTITHWCEAVRTWSLRDLDLLYRLEPLVVMPRATLDASLACGVVFMPGGLYRLMMKWNRPRRGRRAAHRRRTA